LRAGAKLTRLFRRAHDPGFLRQLRVLIPEAAMVPTGFEAVVLGDGSPLTGIGVEDRPRDRPPAVS